MVIYQDTREKKPLSFTSYQQVEKVVVTGLPYGDYACKVNDTRIPVVFERKNIGDLFGTLGKEMKRFKKELNRASKDEVTLIIIIEVDLLKILKGYKYSKMKGLSVIRTLFTLMLKHRVPFVTCKNRNEMELYIVEFYNSYIKNIG
ncbi:MAG: hypothetical protein GY861_11720 [bacterium]|nr:hypothetical protein [bacterium]